MISLATIHLLYFTHACYITYARQHSFLSTFHQNNEFVQHQDTLFLTRSSPMKNLMNQSNYKICITWCASNTNCACVNIKSIKHKFDCLFYDGHAVGKMTSQAGSVLFLKRDSQCPNYCDITSYLNPCGPCRCISVCFTVVPFFCDCTAVVADPQEDCSAPLITADGNLAALYNIRNEIRTLKVMCQEIYGGSNNDLWLAVVRKQNKYHTKEALDFESGFGLPYENNYFIGLDRFEELLKRNSMLTLRIELMTNIDGHHFWVEYDDFQVFSHDRNTFGSYGSKRDFSCVNILSFHFNELLGRVFKRNSLVHGYWVYSRLTFLIKTRKTTFVRNDDFAVKENHVLGYVPYLGEEYCVSFEYKLSAITPVVKLLVMKNIRLNVDPTHDKLSLFFPHFMDEWATLENVPQPLDRWFQINVSRYAKKEKWFHEIRFDGRKLFMFEAGNKTLHSTHTTIMLAENTNSSLVASIKMRNFYVNGVEIA